MYNSEGEREREWEETKKQPDVINFQFVYSCRPFSILCSFCSFSSLALSLCLSNHHPLFRILIVRYAFLCVCVPFEKQQKDNTIRRYGNKNIFFLQTEHRLMTMAAWAIKSRIFTSLKRALNFVETFFMEILHPTEISSNFLPHFSLWTKKWIFPLALIVAFYWVPFELLNLFGFALFNQPYLLTAIYELINYERKTVYMHCSVAFIENEFFVHILWAFIINGDAFLS